MSYPAPPDPAPPLGTPASDNPLAVPVPVPDAADASSQPPQPPLLPDAPPADPAAGVEFPLDADVDTLRNEIQEFYSYVEMPQVSQNEAAWRDWRTLHPPRPSPARGPDEIVSGALGLSIDDPPAAPHQAPPLPDPAWGSLPSSERRQVIEALLSALEVKETDVRMRSLRTLVYLLQGVFGETTGPDHQMYWMHQNARTVRQVGGLSEIVAATKTAGWKHNYLCSLPDTLVPTSSASGEPAEPLLTPQIKAEYLEDVNLELSLCFAALYHVLETGRVDDDDEWGDELMKLDPPLPIYLFNVVADLREKPAKGYPIKKLLLLLWKSILICLGGLSDVERCKRLTRELEGLPPISPDASVAKATPFDIQTFQQDTSTKFPTFVPAPRPPNEIPEEKIASAILPIPRRRPFVPSSCAAASDEACEAQSNGFENGAPVAGGTPAPTPPPSPPPKNKQKFQTDQRRPFIFPFTASVQAGRTVPYAVDEAADLYKRHMHIAAELWQTWRTREEAIREERGVGEDQAFIHSYQVAQGPNARQMHERLAEHGAYMAARTEEEPASTLPQPGYVCGVRLQGRGEPTLALLSQLEEELSSEAKRVEADHSLAVLDSDKYIDLLDVLGRVRADVRRLARVEQIYWSVLPQLPSAVIVLLKLLLATVTAQSNPQTSSPHERAMQSGMTAEEAPLPTLEDVDVARHREVTAKAIAAILLWLLKWFKASHAIKFHFLSLLLTDSNCLLLILKMFSSHEVAQSVCTINEAPLFNFFEYCATFCGPKARMLQPEDSQVMQPHRPGGYVPPPPGEGEEGEGTYQEPEYSFRNLFATIAFTRILQKLTKRRVHRILLLVQYKSSAILKRSLRVSNGAVQRYVLKILRSQVPFCGRKWRQSNMKVITAIYLALTPNLRNEWLAGADVDTDINNSVPQEQALRALIQFYNAYKPPGGKESDRRLNQLEEVEEAYAAEGPPARRTSAERLAAESFFGSDLLPPVRRNAEPTAGSLRYIPDDVVDGYLDNYEDVLGEVFGAHPLDETGSWSNAATEWGLTPQATEQAWARLGEILGDDPPFSETESVSSAGSVPPSPSVIPPELPATASGPGSPATSPADNATGPTSLEPPPAPLKDENRNEWEHLSPKEMRFLSHSVTPPPASPSYGRRRVSRGAPSPGTSPGVGAAVVMGQQRGQSPRLNFGPSPRTLVGLGSSPSAHLSPASPLRPVLPFSLEELEREDALDLGVTDSQDESENGFVPPLATPKEGGIDEVEHIFGA